MLKKRKPKQACSCTHNFFLIDKEKIFTKKRELENAREIHSPAGAEATAQRLNKGKIEHK